MTSKDQIMSPAVATRQSDGYVRPRIATEEALKVLHLTPAPTVWKYANGRPIYNRLPAISQQYQKGYDRDQAYVYLKPKFGKTTGPGSLQAGTLSGSPSVLFVQDGTITWKEGQIQVPAYQVDISELDFGQGLADGNYQVGYLLSFDVLEDTSPVPGSAMATVENSLLSEATISFAASGASENHEPFRALSFDGAWWASGTTDIEGSAVYSLDFQDEVQPDQFILKADEQEPATSTVTLQWSDDNLSWTDVVTANPVGGMWILPVFRTMSHRYWRFSFGAGSGSIEEILYTGTAYFPDSRVTTPQQIATPYLDNVFDEVEGNYLLLSFFEVKDGNITNFIDYRSFSTVPYEPVADWVTKFQDDNIVCLFDDVENYATKFLAPPTADYHFYEEMDLSECLSYDEITVTEQ